MNYEQKKYMEIVITLVLVIIMIGSTVIGTVIGKEYADYERDMCSNLNIDNPISFDLDIEISATTQKDCYEANHYKYFDLEYKVSGGLLGFLIGMVISLAVGLGSFCILESLDT